MTRQPPAPTPQSVTFLTPDDLAPILAKLAEQDTRLAALEAGAVELEARAADHDTLLQDHEERLVALECVEPVDPIEPPVEPVDTREPVPTPDPPPPLPGAGGRLVDPAFGRTIIQVTDAVTAPTNASVSYSNRATFNYDNTRMIINIPNSWYIVPFDPVTLAVGVKIAIPNSGSFTNPFIWDWSGERNSIFYYIMSSPSVTNRVFREYDTATGVATPIKDYRAALQLAGTVEGAASGMSFTHAAGHPVSPILDMPTHFFVQQSVLFTSGANAGQSRVITAYDAASRTITAAEGLTPPLHGDTFVIEPAGYNNHFEATLDGRWLMAAIVHTNGKSGDLAHITVAYDRLHDDLHVGYFSHAQGKGGGAHQIHATHKAGRPYMWLSCAGGGFAYLLWDVLANTFRDAVSFAHCDTGPDGQLITQTAGGGVGIRTVEDPATLTPVYTAPTKQGKGPWQTTYYESWTAQRPDRILHSGFVGDAPVTGWVREPDMPLYRRDNYTDLYAACTLPLTPENDGCVWVNGVQCAYTGPTKASLVMPGQWAFDPAGSGGKGTLWVRGAADEDLTVATNKCYAWDWRYGQDEILHVHVDGTSTRLCKAYTRITAPGASQTNAGIYANESRDGQFAAFTSTWGNRPRRDVFVCVLDRR